MKPNSVPSATKQIILTITMALVCAALAWPGGRTASAQEQSPDTAGKTTAREHQLNGSPAPPSERIIHRFNRDYAGGANPQASLIQDAAGNLYGTTPKGGRNGDFHGSVFELSPQSNGSWSYTALHFFSGSPDGADPISALVMDSSGNLYGATARGGKGDEGIVYKLSPQSDGNWSEQILHNFYGVDGYYPIGSLTTDSDGNLYCATDFSGHGDGGTVFELSPQPNGKWTGTVLYTFAGGDTPLGDLIFDSAGNLYGTAYTDPGFGLVFELIPQPGGAWFGLNRHCIPSQAPPMETGPAAA